MSTDDHEINTTIIIIMSFVLNYPKSNKIEL